MRRTGRGITRLSVPLLLILLSVAACSSVQPQPFSALATSTQQLRDGADASLAVLSAQARERFVMEAALGDGAKIQSLLLEQVQGDPFGWKTDGPVLFLQVARFRDGVFRLNNAVNGYAQLLVQLASPDLVDAKTFDQLAKDLNGNLRDATVTLGMTGANNKDIAIFSTIAAESALAFIESRRQSALVRVIEVNQTTIVEISAAGRSAIKRTAIALRSEYDQRSTGIANAIAGGERTSKVRELVDLNDRFIVQLGVLRTLDKSYLTLPRAHAELAEGLRHPKLTLDMVRQLYENGQHLYRLSQELTKAESKVKSAGGPQ